MRWEDNEALIAAAVAEFGRVDVVWANAGFGATRAGWRRRRSTGTTWC